MQPPEVEAIVNVAERNGQIIGVGISSTDEERNQMILNDVLHVLEECRCPILLTEGKKDVGICDYVDSNVPMLLNMLKKRRRGYQSLGYKLTGERIG